MGELVADEQQLVNDAVDPSGELLLEAARKGWVGGFKYDPVTNSATALLQLRDNARRIPRANRAEIVGDLAEDVGQLFIRCVGVPRGILRVAQPRLSREPVVEYQGSLSPGLRAVIRSLVDVSR